jgi:hypothetical protein
MFDIEKKSQVHIWYHVRLLMPPVHMGSMASPGCYPWYCTDVYLVKTANRRGSGLQKASHRKKINGRCIKLPDTTCRYITSSLSRSYHVSPFSPEVSMATSCI